MFDSLTFRELAFVICSSTSLLHDQKNAAIPVMFMDWTMNLRKSREWIRLKSYRWLSCMLFL